MIILEVKPRGRPIKNLPRSLEVDFETTTTDTLFTRIAAHCGLSRDRLRITKGSDSTIVPIQKEDGKLVSVQETGLTDGSQIFVKDLGPQIAWRTVFVVEYLGPLVIHPLILFYLRPYIYSKSAYNPYSYLPSSLSTTQLFAPPSHTQLLLCALTFLHFLKREYETIFIHRFSSATMPARNIFKNSAHYWILSGINLAYFLYAPNISTTAASWWPTALNPDRNSIVKYAAVGLWFWAEVSNYLTHLTLRNLRPADGSSKRQIPKGYGFDMVTCPNYLFESVAWLAVWILSGGNGAASLFLTISTGQMMIWAKKKELRYRKEFGKNYRRKSVMIPGIW